MSTHFETPAQNEQEWTHQ